MADVCRLGNIEKSPYFGDGLTGSKFGTVTRFASLDAIDVKILKIQKSKMATAAILKNGKKSPYLGNGLTDPYEIWHSDAVRPF